MNIALIFAGGTGVRMKSNGTPKQFLEIFGKPTIIHTLERFDNCDNIDSILIVCLEDWIDHLSKLLTNYNIKKVAAIIPGGETGFDSRYLGLKYLFENSSNPSEDIVFIHDGVRPMIDEKLILNCINTTKLNGNAITVSKANETIIYIDENGKDSQPIDRERCVFARAPQCFYLNRIYDYYSRALEDNQTFLIDSATIANHYGERLFFVEGPFENIKITTQLDYFILRGMWEAAEFAKFFGDDK